MSRYLNHVNRVPSQGYTFTEDGLTVPGQVLDLRTIRDRYSRGQSVTSYPGEYDSPMPVGWEKMDKMQRIDFARRTRETLTTIQDAVFQKERLKAEKRRQDDISAEVAKLIAENNKKVEPTT